MENTEQTVPNLDESSNDNKPKRPVGLIIALIVMAIAIVGVMYYYFDKKQEAEQLAMQKSQLLEQFMDLKDQYSVLETDNDSMIVKLSSKEEEINGLIKELNRAKANNRYIISQYKKELGTLREVLKSYIVQVDSLNTRNKELTAENLRMKTEIAKAEKVTEELQESKQELENVVEKATVLMADGISVHGMNSKGKEVDKIKKIIKLRACFTIRANAVAKAGLKTVYIRILRPDGILLAISQDAIFETVNGPMVYTEKREVEYLNEDVEMCIYWDNNGDLIEGDYVVEIYTDRNMIGTSSFYLK